MLSEIESATEEQCPFDSTNNWGVPHWHLPFSECDYVWKHGNCFSDA